MVVVVVQQQAHCVECGYRIEFVANSFRSREESADICLTVCTREDKEGFAKKKIEYFMRAHQQKSHTHTQEWATARGSFRACPKPLALAAANESIYTIAVVVSPFTGLCLSLSVSLLHSGQCKYEMWHTRCCGRAQCCG